MLFFDERKKITKLSFGFLFFLFFILNILYKGAIEGKFDWLVNIPSPMFLLSIVLFALANINEIEGIGIELRIIFLVIAFVCLFIQMFYAYGQTCVFMKDYVSRLEEGWLI